MSTLTPATSWPPLQQLQDIRTKPPGDVLQAFQNTISDADKLLKKRFKNGEKIELLVSDRARLIDAVLLQA
ncbi:MAG: hypothetical protein KJO35_01010, partial [Gammaproteobacteria bacterium]|nr:hypothetical protein [Gammaproteobacteria bacterium]